MIFDERLQLLPQLVNFPIQALVLLPEGSVLRLLRATRWLTGNWMSGLISSILKHDYIKAFVGALPANRYHLQVHLSRATIGFHTHTLSTDDRIVLFCFGQRGT